MNRNRASVLLIASLFAIAAIAGFGSDRYSGSAADRDALSKTSVEIRAAFARGDIDAIMQYHHPDVIKALAPERYLVGRDAVKADVVALLSHYDVEFTEHQVENMYFQGDTAVEESVFTVKGTPKGDGQPFSYKGRAMVVYVRYPQSPTGWASIREIIQPLG
jgi:ketosteroid isomerase-like protein